jgi:phage FluMu protein Com
MRNIICSKCGKWLGYSSHPQPNKLCPPCAVDELKKLKKALDTGMEVVK